MGKEKVGGNTKGRHDVKTTCLLNGNSTRGKTVMD
jgi:hypothetical protein